MDIEKLQVDAGLVNPPTLLTFELRMAPSGEGPRAYDWSDKPHRLLYEACAKIEADADLLEALEGLTRVAESAGLGIHSATRIAQAAINRARGRV